MGAASLGTAEGLPLRDSEVDYVFANVYIYHVESPPAAVVEMTWIVKPGGMIMIPDLDEHRHRFLLTEHHDRWPGFKRDGVRGCLQAAGLKDANVTCAGGNCCATSESGCKGEG